MQVVNMNVETKLNNIAELEQFEVIEVYSPNGSDNTSIEKAKAVLHPQLFGEDLKHLENIYENASIENKKILLNIVDKLYLMLNRKDINTYNDLEKIINDYFYTSCGRPLELN